MSFPSPSGRVYARLAPGGHRPGFRAADQDGARAKAIIFTPSASIGRAAIGEHLHLLADRGDRR
ncbi:MAG: hypothetical protein U0R26_11145 [Solirubrobacterales bacterium]